MKILEINSVDIDRNIVDFNDQVIAGYEHFCAIADTPPKPGYFYKYEGDARLGGQLTKATRWTGRS